ncbi:GLUG motif-containing protein [Aliarcobacter cryaerophilus]|uniref:GLUG motif-containing protein n=1 Tax=Aliarcobacter cryaerophilus TaxID=28198 RepID=UPI0021B5370F|nr:GLUG motif-containing protein [Aliarcobacter cryaerophilus]MCT7405363.1 filamentous hemagglutinin N-terminal domain-containing protein [Aliarcobacter cryaerophilus]MCT7503109.1 filamentous hemagglutinin N-terminal domain-containing protein [Aliarcobacter cryaerophilus]
MYYKNRFCIVKYSVISLVVASNLYGAPSGGVVTSGNATINQVGNTTNINQSSQKASINWQDFSIKSHESVNFNQPNANSITLNRVIGNEKSIIDGALNANGQVWILNSNGTLFGKNAKVNTSGLLVTTKNLSDEDFQSGNYNFKGNSKASIENQGDINLNDKAYAVFVANSVINSGEIKVHKGNVHLVGADEFSITLNENQNISLKVTKGALNSLVENNNLIVANGGNVYLTTNAKNELLKGVVNNSGIIEAASLDDLQSEVILFANGGTANISGEIKAKGSFVETSGKELSVKDSFKITANKWLLDPTNMTIEANGGSDFNSGSVSATAIQNALANSSVILQADNNITVNQNIVWSTTTQLDLQADSINVNATINNTNQTNGGVAFQAANTTDKVVFGTDGKVIVNNLYQLQWINQALNGKYELGRDIDASATKTDIRWGTAGFNPLGHGTNHFTGTFDGKGFTISNLYINRATQDNVGLFEYTNNATIKNIGLENVNITGNNYVGGLVGRNGGNKGTISNSYATGSVNGNSEVGGLVGVNGGTISNSYATNSVDGKGDRVGGLVGANGNNGIITNSYATGSVSGNHQVGGLLGSNGGGIITNSYATGKVEGRNIVGGLLGFNSGIITNSYATGYVSGNINVGGLVGRNDGTISNSYATGKVDGVDDIGGLIGWNGGGTISNSYASGTVIGTGSGVGGLVGINNGGTISNSYTTGKVVGNNNVGGLIGWNGNQGIISNSYASGTVIGTGARVGGLVGWNDGGTITNSYATSKVDGKKDYVGGLIGYNSGGKIENSYATGSVVSQGGWVGGLIGNNYGGTIENSYASGSVIGNSNVGGLVGGNTLGGTISNSFYNKDKYIGDGVGNDSSYMGVIGKTTAELEDINTFIDEGWSITADSSLAKGTPVFKNGSWIIGTYIAPTPSDNSQKPKVDEKVQKIIASIYHSLNSNTSSNQSVPNSLNSNIRTLSFNGVDETRVINGGVRVPDNIVNSLDEL